jgi:hypothetical protein
MPGNGLAIAMSLLCNGLYSSRSLAAGIRMQLRNFSFFSFDLDKAPCLSWDHHGLHMAREFLALLAHFSVSCAIPCKSPAVAQRLVEQDIAPR